LTGLGYELSKYKLAPSAKLFKFGTTSFLNDFMQAMWFFSKLIAHLTKRYNLDIYSVD